MRRLIVLVVGALVLVTAWPWLRIWLGVRDTQPVSATNSVANTLAHTASGAPNFHPPYNAAQPLENFLVFTAPPRYNIPDGQIHWTELEVPGIDILGPDTNLYNMCPDGGQAWTLQGGDPYGGGTFVAVECDGRASGWQFLAFHLCKVRIGYSISDSNRVYTRIPAGGLLAEECVGGHTHLSLGYWASESKKLPLSCPQWYVQNRYWVNAACLLKSSGLPQTAPLQLNLEEDWELRYLTPTLLTPLRRFALLILSLGLSLYMLMGFLRIFQPPPQTEEVGGQPQPKALNAFPQALIKSGIWVAGLFMAILISAGPVWPVGGYTTAGYTTSPAPYQALAQAVGYGDWELLRAFYLVAIPRNDRGHPTSADEPGRVFPPEAAAAIPFGETNVEVWTNVDPTQPGPYGQYRAWDAVAERWPISLYERLVLGLSTSREAQRQREGLQAIAASADMVALGQRLNKTIRAEDLYGSSAGAVGRTQVLPGHFVPGGLCGDMPGKDVWNDRVNIAECTTRYLSASGCWGSWWANGDVWSALCGYNPGAWNSPADQWYWNVLQDRMTRLTAAAAQVNLRQTTGGAPAPALGEHNVSTPILGLLITETLLQNGASRYGLPGPLNAWLAEAAPKLQPYRPEIRVIYRFFRAWTLIYYAPDDLLKLGIQL